MRCGLGIEVSDSATGRGHQLAWQLPPRTLLGSNVATAQGEPERIRGRRYRVKTAEKESLCFHRATLRFSQKRESIRSYHSADMEGESKIQVPKVKLGGQGLEVSKLGFGCLGLGGLYNAPVSDEVGIAIIKEAFDNGITFFDTSDMYGPHTNEILLGKALKNLPREKVQVATKFGVVKIELSSGIVVCGKPDYVRSCCEASLKHLNVDYIDLYYQHRIDTSIPIEETIGELKKLVEEGKVKYIGLSEASPDTIRRAHAVHPITALQMEWSLWSRDIEEEIVPLCRELGIGIVSYSPLGRGFFGGKAVVEDLPANSFLVSHPRYSGENLEKNKAIYARIETLAMKHHCTPAQLALSWILHQGDGVVPIPGTTKTKNLHDNIGSLNMKLTEQDLEDLSRAVPPEEVAGDRTYSHIQSSTWRYANTPPVSKSSES